MAVMMLAAPKMAGAFIGFHISLVLHGSQVSVLRVLDPQRRGAGSAHLPLASQ